MDLPENITMKTSGAQTRTSYAPIDNHPNPYGHPPPSVPSIPVPSYQQKLPSRDIPMNDTSQYTQDPTTQVNYIPPVSSADYMRQFEETTEKKVRAHVSEKKYESRLERWIALGQTPMMVALIYFIFQTSTFQRVLLFYGTYLGIHHLDGNLTTYGKVLVSFLFGVVYFLLTTSIDYLSEI